jgi:hypothetical protein
VGSNPTPSIYFILGNYRIKLSSFSVIVGENVRQAVGYCIGIAAIFVRQKLKFLQKGIGYRLFGGAITCGDPIPPFVDDNSKGPLRFLFNPSSFFFACCCCPSFLG